MAVGLVIVSVLEPPGWTSEKLADLNGPPGSDALTVCGWHGLRAQLSFAAAAVPSRQNLEDRAAERGRRVPQFPVVPPRSLPQNLLAAGERPAPRPMRSAAAVPNPSPQNREESDEMSVRPETRSYAVAVGPSPQNLAVSDPFAVPAIRPPPPRHGGANCGATQIPLSLVASGCEMHDYRRRQFDFAVVSLS